ncbi:MAG: paraquat-inducible protein A [Campylobacterales bacterium]|nr:paraquat-inducible protein A [Campylobacterales bacterium]
MHLRTVTLVVVALLIALASFFAYKAYSYSKKYEEVTLLIVKENTLNNLASIKLKRMGDILSFGLYDGYDELLKKRKEFLEVKEYYRSKSILYTLFFLITLFIVLILYPFINLALFTIVTTLMALIALAVGIFAPIMIMSIYKNVDILGDITLTAQSKSLFGTLSSLFESGEYAVGGFLLLFSIVFPLFKNLSLIFVSLFAQSTFAHSVVHFFKVLGKWSMADVFVVATLLVFLSSGDGTSHAEIEVGLYFFMMYVIVSMIATLTTDKLLQKTKGT